MVIKLEVAAADDIVPRAIAESLGVEVSSFRAAMDSFRPVDGSQCDSR